MTSSGPGSSDVEFERVLRRHADIIDASRLLRDELPAGQRESIRRLMITLFRAAAGSSARQYQSYSELPGHADGPILGRATLDRQRFVRIGLRSAGQGFGVFWKWADEDFDPDRAIHARYNPHGDLPDRTELSISTDLGTDRLSAVFQIVRSYTNAALPDRDATMAFERMQRDLHGLSFGQARSRP